MVHDKIQNKKDIFESMLEGFDQIHDNIEQSTPIYTQSISNFQQEFLATWKNLVHSNLSTQQEYFNKIGLTSESTEIISQIIQKMTDEIGMNFKLQNSIINTWLDTSKQNIQSINDNSTSFSNVNKKFIESLSNMWNV